MFEIATSDFQFYYSIVKGDLKLMLLQIVLFFKTLITIFILFQFSTRSLEPSFGLLFKDLLDDLGVHTTGASVIASTLDSVVNFSGFFVGPVIKTFSYRKVCFVGSTICALGLLFTAPANSMGHIIATYSILGGKLIFNVIVL